MRYLSVLILWLGCIVSTWATPLTNLVVFGDSLSDTGNLWEYLHHQLPKSPPYDRGRFSNGPIWVEYLLRHYYPSHMMNAHLLNYAFGGAGVRMTTEDDDVLFTLNRELDTYLLTHGDHADPRSMFVVWIGGNNYLGVPDDIDFSTEEVALGIRTGIEKLVRAGAKHITLINLPDLGRTPFAHSMEAESPLHAITERHNQKLHQLISSLQQTFPDVEWIFVDANTVFTEMIVHPERFGFQNVTEVCYDGIDEPTPNAPAHSFLKMIASTTSKQMRTQSTTCQPYLFFDLIHPTTRVHQLIAEQVFKAFQHHQVTFKQD